MHPTRRSVIISVLLAMTPSVVLAHARPFFTIGGRTRSGSEERWMRDEFEAISLDVTTTSTPWHQGVHTFEGIRLGRLLDCVGTDVAAATLHALNDYTATVPVADVRAYDPALAVRRDGADMPIADKGPLFLVYPFDDHPELDNPVIRARSVWQVDAMVLR